MSYEVIINAKFYFHTKILIWSIKKSKGVFVKENKIPMILKFKINTNDILKGIQCPITLKYSFDAHSITIKCLCCVHFHDSFLLEPLQSISPNSYERYGSSLLNILLSKKVNKNGKNIKGKTKQKCGTSDQ